MYYSLLRQKRFGAIAVVRGVALGLITSETLVFPCLLIDGVVATNDSNCPQEYATGAGAYSCGQ